MKLFTTGQIKELDAKTVVLESITSVDLMDRAALALYKRIIQKIRTTDTILILTGPGNNGGDGLALARMLLKAGYLVQTVLCHMNTLSNDATVQLDRLQRIPAAELFNLKVVSDLSNFEGRTIIVDALFGSGLNRPLAGFYAEIVHWINRQEAQILSIDLPSGLFGEDNSQNIPENIVSADLVFGLQFPRLSFLMSDNEHFIKEWELVDIGIHPGAIESILTPYAYTEMKDISTILKKRTRFSHKGTYGKGLLIAGSPGMMGAAILSSKGALRSGIGLLTVRIPDSGVSILQTTTPEAIVQTYCSEGFFDDSEPIDLDDFSAIALGPGIRTGKSQASSLENILKRQPYPLILDADALNLLAENQSLLKMLPKNVVLTPHPKEFDRLTGKTALTGYERLELARTFASEYQVYIILKGSYTACIGPDGSCHFNSTGNPGMATGGTGDVLTGIVLSLLAQGYHPAEACKLGVYLHGLSGDLALKKQSQESLLAGDLIKNLGKAFTRLKS